MTRIVVDTMVSAMPRKVWKHWTSPQHIRLWNKVYDDWYCPVAENDLKEGGRFRFESVSKDGQNRLDFEGVYHKIIALKHISYTFNDGRYVTVDFSRTRNQTRIVEMFEAMETHSYYLQKSSRQAILYNFKRHIEQTTCPIRF